MPGRVDTDGVLFFSDKKGVKRKRGCEGQTVRRGRRGAVIGMEIE